MPTPTLNPMSHSAQDNVVKANLPPVHHQDRRIPIPLYPFNCWVLLSTTLKGVGTLKVDSSVTGP